MMASVLEAQGNTVSAGPAYTAFTGDGLAAYNAVFLLPNGAYYNGVDMPDSGQQALVDYVKNGGGLVTSEAVGDMIQGPGGVHMLQAAERHSVHGAVSQHRQFAVILGQITNDPIMNDQLPSQLVLHPQGYFTEIGYTPKWGATAFFNTNQWTATFGGYGVMAGVVGWTFGSGRVLSLSMFSDSAAPGRPELDDRLVWQLGEGGPSMRRPCPPPVRRPCPNPVRCWCSACGSRVRGGSRSPSGVRRVRNRGASRWSFRFPRIELPGLGLFCY